MESRVFLHPARDAKIARAWHEKKTSHASQRKEPAILSAIVYLQKVPEGRSGLRWTYKEIRGGFGCVTYMQMNNRDRLSLYFTPYAQKPLYKRPPKLKLRDLKQVVCFSIDNYATTPPQEGLRLASDAAHIPNLPEVPEGPRMGVGFRSQGGGGQVTLRFIDSCGGVCRESFSNLVELGSPLGSKGQSVMKDAKLYVVRRGCAARQDTPSLPFTKWRAPTARTQSQARMKSFLRTPRRGCDLHNRVDVPTSWATKVKRERPQGVNGFSKVESLVLKASTRATYTLPDVRIRSTGRGTQEGQAASYTRGAGSVSRGTTATCTHFRAVEYLQDSALRVEHNAQPARVFQRRSSWVFSRSAGVDAVCSPQARLVNSGWASERMNFREVDVVLKDVRSSATKGSTRASGAHSAGQTEIKRHVDKRVRAVDDRDVLAMNIYLGKRNQRITKSMIGLTYVVPGSRSIESTQRVGQGQGLMSSAAQFNSRAQVLGGTRLGFASDKSFPELPTDTRAAPTQVHVNAKYERRVAIPLKRDIEGRAHTVPNTLRFKVCSKSTVQPQLGRVRPRSDATPCDSYRINKWFYVSQQQLNTKRWKLIRIVPAMVGFRLGEFVDTRQAVKFPTTAAKTKTGRK